jgi:hypothetical protein
MKARVLHLVEIVDENHDEQVEDDVRGQHQKRNEIQPGDVGVGVVGGIE